MASITIRNLEDDVKERLRMRAARCGHSMEEEARLILRRALGGLTGPELLAISDSLFGAEHGVDLEPVSRAERREGAIFDE